MSLQLHVRWSTVFRIMLVVLSAAFLPATPAWAVDALITSGGSANKNSPTPIAIGQTLNITGSCRKRDFLDSRERSNLYIYRLGSLERHELGSYYSADELDHVQASVTVGTTPYTQTVGEIFDIELFCRGGSNGFAHRYYRVIPEDKPPLIKPFGIWMDVGTKAAAVDITANIEDAGSGIGKVWVKWTGEAADNIEMTDMGRYYKHTIDLTGMPEGVKEVQMWAETPSHANTGWQAAGSFILDRSPPALSNSEVEDHRSAAFVRTNAVDTLSGIRSVKVRWEENAGGWWRQEDMQYNSATKKYSYTIDKDTLRSGEIAVEINARDWTDNDTGWVRVGSMQVDHPRPAITWDERNAKFAGESMHVRAHVAAGSGYRIAETWIRWKGAPSSGFQMKKEMDGFFSYDIPTEGMAEYAQQDVEFWSKDNVGMTTSWMTPDGASFTVDKSAPVIKWDNTNAAYAKGSTTIKADIDDIASGVKDVWITWTGETSKTIKMVHGSGSHYSYAIPALPDGAKEVRIWAADNIGNATGWSVQGKFIVDNTAPAIDWLTPLDQAVLTGDGIRITGNLVEANPDYVEIEWQAVGETAWLSHIEKIQAGSNDFAYELPALQPGSNYRLRMHAVDKAGNASIAIPARTVIGQLAANVLFENSLFAVVEHSLVDKDGSGGFSRGDDLIYAIELQAGNIAAQGVSLRYTLPDGLALTPGTRPYFAPESATTDGSRLNAHWDGAGDPQLLGDSLDLAPNGKLILHIPVTVTGFPAASPLRSTVLAGARNAKDTLPLEQQLALQDKFPANRALDLEFTSLHPDWKYRRGMAFDYRIALRVRAWDLSDVELRYALPPGLERNGEARLEGDGASAMQLNPAWGKNGAALLLSSVPGAKLAALHSFNVMIPVKIAVDAAPGSALQSEIEAQASNMNGAAIARHRIVLSDVTDPEDQLLLTKTVDQKTALPGQTLRYTITYANVGLDDLHDLVIRDAFQSEYLTLGKVQCGPLEPRTLHCAPIAGSTPGQLEWRLDGKLEFGDSGSVSYEVKVNSR
ncbi:MAG TPA: Ig-like domain-containing protein [Herbaspirillum sp.]|jgi:uncharacterized repeat protein (TIGR01451 family)